MVTGLWTGLVAWSHRGHDVVTVAGLGPGTEAVTCPHTCRVTRVAGAGREGGDRGVGGVVARVTVGRVGVVVARLVRRQRRYGRVWCVGGWDLVLGLHVVTVRRMRIARISCIGTGGWKTGGQRLLFDDRLPTHGLVFTDERVQVLYVVHGRGQDLHPRDLLLLGCGGNGCPQLLKPDIDLLHAVTFSSVSSHSLGHCWNKTIL